MKALGLCIGASNVNYVIVEENSEGIIVKEEKSIPHEGNPRDTIKALINNEMLAGVDKFAVTGRKLRHMVLASTISEPEALEYAYAYKMDNYKDANLIVSAGGETFMVYQMDGKGKIIDVYTGNKCASGTGEFFLQQLKRMDITVEEAVSTADTDNPYRVAGRCSVFCKSDCTHALNKGAAKESIVAGLCEMMAGKIIELLKKSDRNSLLVVGGTSDNAVMIDFLRKKMLNVRIPMHARCFESLGAAIWALGNKTIKVDNIENLFTGGISSFTYLPVLKDFANMVEFKSTVRKNAEEGDICIIGLDVGSTTTKAVLMRENDSAILASSYLRTNGDPIGAAKKCYGELVEQVECNINIIGLGVTGSGRQIAGLHGLTPAVINEIIAHAAAAAYFDPQVDTIFEIGGQDAKYTYITNGVPSDYAMNEACSAGTGSFLEEAAKESLSINTEEIGNIALLSKNPPNFNDQCAAFIGSDIKSAIQSGIEVNDIAAGLVYSICLNYTNRVKGSRAIGQKVFMQGGVCYNKAVPIAMAALTGKKIVVPPEPGLMGAFGVALEAGNKIRLGLLEKMSFDLTELANREVEYKDPFYCVGGKEKCDRKCSINRIKIKDRVYPFGGACNKYYNMLVEKKEANVEELDLVILREKMLFETFGKDKAKLIATKNNKTIGLNNTLLINSLYPLYYNFFTSLGYNVIYAEKALQEGMDRKGSSFCYPVELAHGILASLIEKSPDIYFLPHVKSMPVKNGIDASVTCPFVQAEPYYLKTAFSELANSVVIDPVLDFAKGYESERATFIKFAKELGNSSKEIEKAYDYAVSVQNEFQDECKKIGRKFLKELEKNPEETAVVLFGRPYNAFSKIANMGIPKKFASRGIRIIPHDFLPYEDEESSDNMYWAMGQMIMKAAKYVKKHQQLYGAYITNFSCGPDSFLIGYFRNTMEEKPSLTLELDSHTADAGIDTRIEAFMDVIKSYIEITKYKTKEKKKHFTAAKVFTENESTWVIDSNGNKYDLDSKKVHLLVPSMGDRGSKMLSAALRYSGVNSSALSTPTEKDLKKGRGYSSCKECLPLILTAGGLLNYLEERKDKDEILVYFMPDTSGPCRFGQYSILMKNLIDKFQIENVALLSLTSENSYAGFGKKFAMRAWEVVIIGDVLEEIYSAVLVLSKDKEKALKVFKRVFEMIVKSIEKDNWDELEKVLKKAAAKLSELELSSKLDEVPKVALIGEIFVRKDDFSRQYMVEKLAQKNIMVKTAPIAEWIYYCDYIVKNKLVVKSSIKDILKTYVQEFFKNPYEKKIKEIFSNCGFYKISLVDVNKIINNVSDLVSPRLTGETILTVGAAITEVVEDVDGVISIGPFGCMPNRISEAIISETINYKKLETADDKELVKEVMKHYPSLPFLSIETDGNVFPQIIESRLETFCLQVERMSKKIIEIRGVLNVSGKTGSKV